MKMLLKLKLQNYRKVVDDTMSFTPGLNVIRGANEASKTTRIESISYALFGSKALSEPVGKLRVELDFLHLGVEYHIYRAAAGAEITFPGGRVTGQKDVTKFVEGILGTNADSAAKLMVAEQTALRGVLDEGPTGAGKMIEYLANFDLLDRIIYLVQEKLMSGQTAGAEQRVTMLESQITEYAPADLGALVADVATRQADVGLATERLQGLTAQRDELDLAAANAFIADEKRLQASIAEKTAQHTRLTEKLAVALPVAPTKAAIAAARAAVAAQKQLATVAAVRAKLAKLPNEALWDKPLPTLEQEIAEVARRETQAQAAVNDLLADAGAVAAEAREVKAAADVKLATLRGKLIKETNCAFCDKELTDVPEVVLRNGALEGQIEQVTTNLQAIQKRLSGKAQEIEATLAAQRKVLAEASEYAAQLADVMVQHGRAELVYAQAAEYVKLDTSGVPSTWTWVGPDAVPNPTAEAELQSLEAKEAAAVTAKANHAAFAAQLLELEQALKIAKAQLQALPMVDAHDTVLQHGQFNELVKAADAALDELRQALREAEKTLQIQQGLAEQALKAHTHAKESLDAARTELAEMQANNALIKKVRGARPQITDQLWALVLNSVSKYAGQIRGEVSTITRADDVFKINGRPVKGLSGSGKDALGLAIRIALTKTFLPGVGLLVLDEPASACEAERETAMLGLLATVSFDQIILVTHSELCDAYAQDIIFI
jgi:DNA repair exonuclease SbcCD ATPase subunit